MKVHMHTQFCLICLLTFVFHQCHHCHGDGHDHSAEKSNASHDHNYYQISDIPYLQNGRTESAPNKQAEDEQKYYIEKLFERYGENGRLSFFGLEKLLTNLGLGEIKVVEINHEDIGHDYVSHLDAIEVQEGKHSHSHGHSHSHSHSSSENQTVNEGPAKRKQKCHPEKEIMKPSLKPDGKHPHDQNNHWHRVHRHRHHPHHHLNHNGTHHPHNDSIHPTSDHGEPSHEPSTETNTTQEQPEGKPCKHRKKCGDKKKSSEVLIDPVQGRARYRHTSKREASHKQNSVGKHDIHSPHNHKDHNEDDHHHEECLNVTQLLRHYGLRANAPISHSFFTYLCPALLYQIDRRLCIEHYEDVVVEDFSKGQNASLGNMEKTGASAWICGIISITVISLLSLLGVILIPIINQGCFKFLLTFLVALAVGTMSGDALLHLLPHSQGAHNHSHHEGQGHQHEHQHVHGHSHGHREMAQSFLDEYDAVLKGLVALGGIYLLFIIEHCIRMFKHYKKQRSKQKWCKKKQKADESPVGRKLSDHKLNRPDTDWLQLKPLAGADDSVLSEDRLNETELTDLDGQFDNLPKAFLSAEEENSMLHSPNDVSRVVRGNNFPDVEFASNHREEKILVRKHNHLWPHKHSHHSHGHCHSSKDLKDTGIANIAWMVIMGDGIHNFSDGLAIGAAFSAGLTGGISTSIAVFCHELPHELGDFAVLLKAGMTVKQAIVYNLLSAMMAYVGMLIGTAVGQYANNITLWIFAITAGMFLYVALVDMLPEMLHGDGDNEEHGYCPVGQFILQNLGLVLGFAIMLVIALYEDKIVLDIQF
uniref:Zinc transporter ZIP10 n=1 Tax=Pogona vitticeps TaxID=103695 RepID=A0A6J0UX97_9SAUR